MPDASSQMSHATAVHNATMRQTEPRFLANYWNASGPGPHMNDPWQRTGFPKPYLSKHTTFTRSDRFQYGDAFSANRGIRDRVSPGPGRYPPPPSDFDKHVKSKPLLKPGARRALRATWCAVRPPNALRRPSDGGRDPRATFARSIRSSGQVLDHAGLPDARQVAAWITGRTDDGLRRPIIDHA